MPVSKNKDQKPKTKMEKPKAAPIKSESKVSKAEASEGSKFSLSVFDLSGAKKGSVALPKEIFGGKINESLMAQAVRVHLANRKQGTASTKDRGEVKGSTRKIYRQKGTGRARHGSIKAPIFVGGGIVFGPRPGKHSLKLSKQMKKKALTSALSQKFADREISIVDANGASGKTKEFATLFKSMNLLNKKKRDNLILFVLNSNTEAKRGVRNFAGVKISNAESVNTYDVLANKYIVFEKAAVTKLVNHFNKQKEE